jgi:hypothetical protein
MREEIQRATLLLLQDVLKKPDTNTALRGVLNDVLVHPETAQNASVFLANLVELPETRDAMIQVSLNSWLNVI